MFGLPKFHKPELILKDWNVVFHYTTSFPFRSVDLPKFLGRLIKSGLCEVAVHSVGVISWRDNGSSKIAHLDLKTHSDGLRYRDAQYKLPAGIENNPYAVEGSFQMLLLRAGELDVLNPAMAESIGYVRGIMSPCILDSSFGSISLYPQITLYENGVLNVTFRLMAPSASIHVDELVENFLDLFKHHMNDLRVPPSLVRLDTHNYMLVREIQDRKMALREVQRIENLIQNNTKVETHGAFDHLLMSVNPDPTNGSNAPMNVELLNSMIFSSVACLLNPPPQKWKFRWFGSKQRERVSWGTWVGHHNVYIFSFENQPEKATDIHHKYARDLAKIMARTTNGPQEKVKEFLGKSLRLFEDYGVYVNSAINLWIYSAYGLKARGEVDANRSRLIYGFEAQAQFIDFISAAYQRLEERSFDDRATVSALTEDRREMYLLERILAKPAKSGEVKDLFDTAFHVLGLDHARTRVREGTELSLERLREKRDYNRLRFEWLLIVVIGIFSANGLGKDFIQPLWLHFGLPILYPKQLQGPFFISIVFVLLSVLIGSIWIFVQRQREDR